MVPWPADCADCAEDMRQVYGCGFDGYAGEASVKYANGADELPESRTCPRHCWLQPAVQLVYNDLEDYRRGALGSVMDMPAPMVELLRIADAEQKSWECEQQAQLLDSGITTGTDGGKKRHFK